MNEWPSTYVWILDTDSSGLQCGGEGGDDGDGDLDSWTFNVKLESESVSSLISYVESFQRLSWRPRSV